MRISKIISQFNLPTKEILIASGICVKAGKLVEKLGFKNSRILIVTDEILHKKIAGQISATIPNQNLSEIILENPKADEENLLKIVNNSAGFDLIIAIGSGTINDLCKLAATIKSIPYIIFGTAPSMNGYLSGNASILIQNHKQTLPAKPPLALYLDLDLQSSAPENLICAGIGDSLCFSTCKFDWLLAHLVFGTVYNPLAFELLKSRHQKLIAQNDDLRDKKFIKLLCEILVISGIGMYLSGGSYPASQGEHLIAHYLEMFYANLVKNFYHGQQIAVTILTMAKIQEEILKIDKLQIKQESFGAEIFKIEKDILSPKQVALINQNLQQNWPKIKRKLSRILIKKNQLLELYDKFNLPKNPEDIGINSEIYQEAVSKAHMIRNRFTSLDILHLHNKVID